MSVRLYTADIEQIGEEEFRSAYFSMSGQRQKKCSAYRFEKDKKLCIAADMLLRRALKECCGITEFTVAEGEYGKPYLAGGGAFFSVSHAGRLAAVCVSDKEVGVDVEQIKPVKTSLVKHFCAPADIDYIFGSVSYEKKEIGDEQTLRRFFEIWTLKEAYGKYTGRGLCEEIRKKSIRDIPHEFRCPEGYVLCIVTDN